jgi:hypothetical protein|tara:strand:- start:183 stop:1316 length:1134 start_codon:yes stop_codon:yes gene_type:complete
MKKISYLILIFFTSILFFYFLAFFYFYISANKELKNNFFSDTEKLNFYKKHSEIVNHVRLTTISDDTKATENINLNEMLFTVINKSDAGSTILFQGDSWIQQITDVNDNSNYLKNNLGPNYTILGAGISSYSPSLMSIQFKLLEENFKIKPDFLVTYIDQTDIGDEACRYKNLKKYDLNGNLKAVTYEKYPLFVDPFNIDKIIKFSEIDLSNTTKIYKVQKYMNYKIMKSLNRIIKMTKYKINKVVISNDCGWSQIEKNLISGDVNDINYFKKSVTEYFTRISKSNNLKKIYVVTHPQYKHLTGEYQTNVSDIIDQISIKFPKVNHINFTKMIKNNNNFYPDKEFIWGDDNIHLKNEFLREKFIKNIVKYFIATSKE